MSLNEKLTNDLKEAMMARDELRVSTIRFLMADMKNLKIEKQRELEDEDIAILLERQVKRHRESIEAFEKGNRTEMAAKEKKELSILQSYLPEQMSREEIEKEVTLVIASSGASSITEMGRLMGMLSAKLKGKADMGLVSDLVKQKLS